MTHSNLCRLGRVKAGQHHPSLVGHAIAICILEVVNVRRAGHEDPALPEKNPVGITQAGCEFGAAIVTTVAVGILQHGDSALGRGLFSVQGIRIAPVLHHIESPVLVEGKGHRVDDEGFRRHQFDPEARFELECRECRFR